MKQLLNDLGNSKISGDENQAEQKNTTWTIMTMKVI